MKQRERRLRRLVDLRTKQHDSCVSDLKQARAEMSMAEDEVREAVVRSEAALDNIGSALGRGDQQEWLLSSADAELAKIASAHAVRTHAEREVVMAAAALAEANARRELRQMEATLETVQRDDALRSARAEQQTLDETARLLSGGSSTGLHKRRAN